jgi:hypothetical protein
MTPSGTEALLTHQEHNISEHLKTQEDLRISLLVRAVVTESLKEHSLSPEEQHWVRLAIKREARIEEFRSAVIEKTLSGILWAAVVGIGYAIWSYLELKLGVKKV